MHLCVTAAFCSLLLPVGSQPEPIQQTSLFFSGARNFGVKLQPSKENVRVQPTPPTVGATLSEEASDDEVHPIRHAYDTMVLVEGSQNRPNSLPSTLRRQIVRRGHRTYMVTTRTNASRGSRTFGAGVTVSADGYVVTANHVVANSPYVTLITTDGRRWVAEKVDVNEENDLALLKFEPGQPIKFAYWADDQDLERGKVGVAIGNPGGSGMKASVNIIGDKRLVAWERNKALLLSVTGNIVPGHSGGGEFDFETGKLLGLIVAKSSTQQNTGYVAPIEYIRRFLSMSSTFGERENQTMVRAALGVVLKPTVLTGTSQKYAGLRVEQVDLDGFGSLAGWKVGDIILQLDDYQIQNNEDVVAILTSTRNPEDASLAFILIRAGKMHEGLLSLDEHRHKSLAIESSPTKEPNVLSD